MAGQKTNIKTTGEIQGLGGKKNLHHHPPPPAATPHITSPHTLVKPISFPCIETELLIFQFLPISFALWHTSFDKRFIEILSTTKSYTPNLGHKRQGRGISLLKAGPICGTNIWYRKLVTLMHCAVLSGTKGRRKVWIASFPFLPLLLPPQHTCTH